MITDLINPQNDKFIRLNQKRLKNKIKEKEKFKVN
jgi:hypothetical protein